MTLIKKTELQIEGKHARGNSKPVFCITTGEVYPSVTDAAEKHGVTVSAISYAMMRKSRSCKGNKFCLVDNLVECLPEISIAIISNHQKAIAYDAIITEQKRRDEANEKLRRHREACEKLRQQMEAEMKALADAEAEVKAFGLN